MLMPSAVALTVERALGWASTNKTSPLYGQDAVQIYRDIVKQAEETPFHSPECGKSGACDPNVTAQDILNSLETWTETPTDAVTFLEFAQVLKQTQKGNATGFARPYFTNQEAKTSSTPWTQAAIACQDWCPDTNWTAYQNWANMFTNNAIPAGGTFFGVVQIVCPHWPTPVRNPPRTIDIPNPSAPILVVNALWDPVTGYDQAVGMQRRIANSVLLTRNGEGHGTSMQ
jgi:pimeloyl-ACP methyl ester carboxylesterase